MEDEVSDPEKGRGGMDARHTEITLLLSERLEASAAERLATEVRRAQPHGHHRLAQIRDLIGRALAGAGPCVTDQPTSDQPITDGPCGPAQRTA